ncbi:hypothetical protein ACVU7I_00180 [Patulibacter sp. S7RM1-6]
MTPAGDSPGEALPVRAFWISSPTLEAFATRVTTLLGEHSTHADEIHLERTVRPAGQAAAPDDVIHEGTLVIRAR